MEQTIAQKVTNCVAILAGFKPEDVKPEDELEGRLAMDSLDKIELVMAVEEEFEVEAALASRDAEIERLRAKLDENAMPDDYILIVDQLASERLEKNRLREALAMAEGVALRVIAETGFDESKVADWRPVVRDALRPVGPATQAAREVFDEAAEMRRAEWHAEMRADAFGHPHE